MFKFIHAADLHLDSPLRGLSAYEGCPAEKLRAATRQAFEKLVELAVEESVAFVIISGDIFDGDWKDYNTGLFFCTQLSRLGKAGIPVYLLSGNHDAQSNITRTLKLPDNVRRFSTRQPETVRHDGLNVALHGQGFAQRAVDQNLAATYPDATPDHYNIGVLHTALDGREDHDPYAPCSLQDLESKGYDYWALGHVHAREVVSEDPWVVFPGNTQGRGIREPGAKGCEIVTVDDDQGTTIEHQSLDVVRWGHLTIATDVADSAYAVRDALSNAIADRIGAADGRTLALRVTINGQCAAHEEFRADPERWINEFRVTATDVSGEDVWIEKICFQTSTPRNLEELAGMDGPVGHLLSYMEEVCTDADVLDDLAGELKSLGDKLPRELCTGDEPLDLSDHDWLKEVVLATRGDLAQRLLETEHDS